MTENEEDLIDTTEEDPVISLRPSRLVLFLFPLTSLGCAGDIPPEIDLAAEAQTIRDLDVALSDAAQNRDAGAFGSFFAEDAIQLPPDAPPERGRAVIQEGAAGLLGSGADLRFETVEVRVAGSGDMAVSRGRWFLIHHTPNGPVHDEGSYVEVWEKVAGEWKITVDIYNRDLPEG